MSGLFHRLKRTLKGRKETYDDSNSIAAELQSNTALLSRLNGVGENGIRFSELDGACEIATPHGVSYQLVTQFPLQHVHGAIPLTRTYTSNCSALEGLAGDLRLQNFDPEDALFLDIEATGLDHGAGTFAFMVGLGYRENDMFTVRQLFLPNMHDELPMLHILKEHLERFKFLISFNGKSYDLTVLQSRMVLQRLYSSDECNLKLQPHLDLLHLARNMYRKCFENTRLPTLEDALLDFRRVNDVPSSLVPTMWFEFLRTQDAGPIKLVAEHNLYDVLSMLALTGELAQHSHLQEVKDHNHAQIAVNVGRIWIRRKNMEQAIESLESANDAALSADELNEKYGGLNKAYRRNEDYTKQGNALARWCVACPNDADAWTAQAIYLEKRAKILSAALDSAYRAHTLAPSQDTSHRLQRLKDRLGKSS